MINFFKLIYIGFSNESGNVSLIGMLNASKYKNMFKIPKTKLLPFSLDKLKWDILFLINRGDLLLLVWLKANTSVEIDQNKQQHVFSYLSFVYLNKFEFIAIEIGTSDKEN